MKRNRSLNKAACLQRLFPWIVAICLTANALAAERPNIVFMLADDQAWNGTSVAMHPSLSESKSRYFQTPHLEKLAAQGMRFSQAYAPAPVCSPTRISLQTGKSPAQLHWTKAAPAVEGMKLTEPRLIKSLSRDEITIAELLKRQGYLTAHLGKWHLAGGGPGEHGYDTHDGDTGNEHAFKFSDTNPVDIVGMAERAHQWMTQAKVAGKPFYIQLSWNALHAPENASKAAIQKYKALLGGANEKAIATAAITEDLDRGVGQVMDSIEQLGLTASTYVIYMSDNGAGGGDKRGALRGGKGGVWEGGLRVPLIVRGPSVAANSWCHVPVVGYDLMPTFCHWAGVPAQSLPDGIEGGDLTSLLTSDNTAAVKRRFNGLTFHFPHYQSEGPQSSILVGSLKLVHLYETDTDLLYDLSQDIGERHDLKSQMPREAIALRKQLDEYLAAVQAQLPVSNPDYDPHQAPPVNTKRGSPNSNRKSKSNGK